MSQDGRAKSGWVLPEPRRRSRLFYVAAGLLALFGAAFAALLAYTVFILLVAGW
jgi:hypothetical protein